MNDRIKNVVNERVEIEDIKATDCKREINRITVEFLHAEEKGWKILIETATLKNYVEETDEMVSLAPLVRNPHIGLTNCKSIDFFYEDDEIILIDGAEFSITVRTSIWDKMETYTFVLKGESWELKEDNKNG